ncbi:MAG: hypothetical protein EA428_01060 [Spirochaetaceae bacterium]|nr:MAG: hypothetical protein EA428_01060 [Spirochaetaceae bacterium]
MKHLRFLLPLFLVALHLNALVFIGRAAGETPFSDSEYIVRRALQLLPDDYSPILSNGEAHALVRDLHGEGMVDVVIAAVRGKNVENRLEVLADISRLYVRGLSSPELFVFVYKSSYNRLEERGRYSIGDPPVFEGLHFRRLSRAEATTSVNAVIVETMRSTGRIEEWLIYGSGAEQPTRMTIRNTHSERWRTTEIGEHGTLDLLRYQTAYEQGSGMETFITRYTWDGGKYRGDESLAVVRSLNSFLEHCETLLNNHEYEAFIEFALPPHMVDRPTTVLQRTFIPVTEEFEAKAEHPFPTGDTNAELTHRYILPRVLQSPFPFVDSPSFEIYVRTLGPHQGLYRARVRMAEDPFSDSPYFLTGP